MANFRSIFDHASREETLEEYDDSISEPQSLPPSGLTVKSIISVVVFAIIVACVFVIWPVNLHRNIAHQSAASEKKLKQKKKFFFEPIMTPDRVNKILVFGVRTTQPPPAILIDSSCFFSEERKK